ncbi:hypothetical protein BD309DRAFT_871666 [Dichomitus squalens]|uniref:Uncharacterized protein n=1 Tax=Dichomitus squalens TaxID=114155 RepID=A0A4Q9Q434_9APHY|nr:hypothetical protein BD309DRAFT_871666 [Dichomitus squalens]TBU61374.1 hypothetical protein BD310DRAFT_946520 [Dichomitus squalens]
MTIADQGHQRPSLVSLEVFDFTGMSIRSGLEPFIHWLLHTPSRLTICHLTYEYVLWPFSDGRSACTTLVGQLPSLTTLVATVYPDSTVNTLPLSHLKHLEDLWLQFFQNKEGLSPWDVMAHIVSGARSRLRRLRITIQAETSIDTQNLEKMDPVLEGPSFTDLDRMHFDIRGSDLSSELVVLFGEDVKQKLPKLYARGIVEVS